MDKKRKLAIALIIIVIGIIITSIFGFNVQFSYRAGTRLQMHVEKVASISDIKEICKEVLGKEKFTVQYIDVFKDAVAITVKEITDEQVDSIISKINEKYETEINKEETAIIVVPAYRIRDIFKPYILPSLLTIVLILIYFTIIYRKNEFLKRIIEYITGLAITELMFFSLIAITRIPFGSVTVAIGLVLGLAYTIMYAKGAGLRS